MDRKITLKYMILQALYWGVVCAAMGYTVTYMKDLGYSNSYIGVAMAIANLASVFAQPTIANIADRNPKWTITKVNIVLSVMMLVISAVMMVYKNATLLLTLIICVLTVVNGLMQPFLNSLAIKYQESGVKLNYGVCRAAGSLFYAVVSSILGELVVYYQSSVIPIVSTILCAMLLVAAVINRTDNLKSGCEKVIEDEDVKATALPDFIRNNKRFFVYIIGVSLVFYMHMVLTTYSIQIVENVGGDASSMGFMLAISAVLELPAMIGSNYLLKRYKVQTLLKISAVSFSIKALAMTVATTPGMIYVAQLFQLSAFALYIPCSVYYVGRLFDKRDMNKGQSMTTMATAIGPVFSNLFTGYLIDRFSVNTMLWISLVISIIGTIIMILMVEEFRENKEVIPG